MNSESCVVFGQFPFVHRGHARLFEALPMFAAAIGFGCHLEPVVCVFRPPKKFYWNTRDEVDTMIEAYGFTPYWIEEENFSHEFFKDILLSKLHAKAIVTDEGNPELARITKEAEQIGIQVLAIDPEMENGERIDEAMIEKAFRKADFPLVSRLCGHAFSMNGVVVHGKALGRKVGMPTANLRVDPRKRIPPFGVYETTVTIPFDSAGGGVYKAVTNVGTRPTVDAEERISIEAHILDFNEDIYGKTISIAFDRFIRPIRKFADLSEVKNQVRQDIATIVKSV